MNPSQHLRDQPAALSRRKVLAGAAALGLAGSVRAVDVLRVGVLNDVADDYLRFIQNRDVATLEHFGGAGSRREVMELAWLLREIKRQPKTPDVQLMRTDSYQRLLFNVRDGSVDVGGSSAWLADLEMLGSSNLNRSSAMIPKGHYLVGVYTSPRNEAALLTRTLDQLRVLRFTCNSNWQLDWSTLRNLGIAPPVDVQNWGQMVTLVDSGRADALLAPFQAGSSGMELHFQGRTLVPIAGIAVALNGSCHLASSKHSALGKWVATNIFPALTTQVKGGALRKAYEECGFYPPGARSWTIF